MPVCQDTLRLTILCPACSQLFCGWPAQDTFKLPQLEAYDTNTENILTTRMQPGPFNGYPNPEFIGSVRLPAVHDCLASGSNQQGLHAETRI